MAKRKKLTRTLDGAVRDSTVKVVAASAAVAAGGAVAAGKVVRERLAERQQKREVRRYRLEPDETRAEGVTRVARGQLDLTIALIEGREGDDPAKAIHDARKALKRTRALLRLSRDALRDEVYRRENKVLRDVGRELSGARDAQVLVETMDGLTSDVAGEIPAETLARFGAALQADAERAKADQQDQARLAELVATLEETQTRVATWALSDGGGPQSLGGGLQRIYRRGRRALEAAKEEPSDERLHELRKRAKDLWHATQLLGPAAGKRMKKVRRRAHRLSDLLGDDHDLAVLMERARSTPQLLNATELELITALVERRRTALRRQAFALGSRLYRSKPRKLRRRLSPSR